MKQKLIRFILASAYVSVLCAPATINAFDIVKDGKPAVTVVIPAFTPEQKETDQRWTGMAANWFTNYVRKATGADIRIVTEGAPVEGRIVSIGHTKMAEASGITMDVKKQESKKRSKSKKADITITTEERAQLGNVCRLAVKGDTLFLIGKDQYGIVDWIWYDGDGKPRHSNNTYNGPKGTCLAVAKFLEDYLGCRWFIPTPQGECVPATNSVSVPEDLDRTVTPLFPHIKGGPYCDPWNPKSPAQMANNGWGQVLVETYGGHSWNVWAPGWKYGKAHPEYYAIIDGKRLAAGKDKNGNDHLCTSNPEVRALLLKEIRARFDMGYDWVQLGQSDGYRRCQCPECEKLDNFRADGQGKADDPENPCERILLLHKYLIDECAKSHPDKKVHLLVYGPTTWPSKKFDTFGGNVVAEVCHYYDKTLPLWKPKVWASTVYVYWWGTYQRTGIGPKSSPQSLAEKIRLLRDNNVIGIYFCGGGEDWGLEGPVYYTVGRLLDNPDLNPNDCVNEYCRFVYGKAAGTMVQFFNALYERTETDFSPKSSKAIRRADIVFPALLPPDVLRNLDSLLGRAEREADSEQAKGWLGFTRMSFDYSRFAAEMYTLYHSYQIQKDLPSLKALRASVGKWQACRQKMLEQGKDKDYVTNWFPGWYTVRDYLNSNDTGTYAPLQNQMPVMLNFDQLEKNLLQNKTGGQARMAAPRSKTPVTMDNLLDELTWKDAKRYPLEALGAAITANTQVRLMFDDKNLYIRFECEEPEIGSMKLEAGGRDGNIWSDDCVEMLLDPWATRVKFMHLITAPKEGCFYDARFGFITDPLNPLVGKEDPAWNADWQYRFKIDNDGKNWIMAVVIPFAGLGVETPKAGAVWIGNFGRERYAGKKAEYSLWSCGDATGFCDPAAFGEICFEQEPGK